jgi:hypothetical protein
MPSKDIGYFKSLASGLGIETNWRVPWTTVFSAAIAKGHGQKNVSRLLDL